ncbi:hypothetical protein XMM379_002089 [Aliiroseovarius sp. xm-m-379]|uniref:hypothetical protein n=1 Tax=unclassified Aliiroseovarius TaxID=2623558 RepID=UPI001569DBC0|nr:MULTISPECIES: hypothetical protein [unclassified Aliiroseovarius]NRP13963.1 hypothetical protein [Aliiroseovarius sp. xm-d-517]NRP25392.1 hypothetical protein [Aliiroseovarius sp. xm-m-379]NRP29384.1 hypothetical protein [Aliiroseovarius sp. xm-m-314]NRP34191.1 hypothetical protein [Aliiroseovarius sp. xm-a-104]NRP41850.1 hypothetical protein [Aliiroseovarius sp. xm-m-339-2]
MFKIEGLDDVQKQFAEIEQAVSELSGSLGSIEFEPTSREGVERAILAVESMIDDRLRKFSGNAAISEIAEGLKREVKAAIMKDTKL